MISYPIYTISAILLSWKHDDYTWHLTHYTWYHSYCICVVTPSLWVASKQLWMSSHFSNIWHHTYSTSYHIHTLWHQSSVFMTSQTLHDIRSPIYDITHMTTQTLYLHLTHDIWHYNHSVCVIKPSVSILPHPLSLYDITHYIMTSHSVSMISH